MIAKDELKKMSMRELEDELRKIGIERTKLQLAVRTRQSKETAKLKALRKYVAQIKTTKRMLEIESLKKDLKPAA